MAIKDYENEPRSDGWRGIRVYHTVHGTLVQKYFSKGQIKEAKAFNANLIKQHPHRVGVRARRHSQQYQYQAARYDPPRRTKVVGICMAFSEQRNCTPVRYYPCFQISCHNKERGQKNSTSRFITPNRDLPDTWKACCQLLAEWRNDPGSLQAWYKLCPTVTDFSTLRHWYCDNDRPIPVSSMKIFEGVRA